MTAASYGRVSSNLQKVEESIEQQLEQSRRWARENGYVIVDEYSDEAMSGTREDRPQFNQMIGKALSKSRPYDAVIVWHSSRIARNTALALWTRHKLSENDVRFVSLNQQIDEDDNTAVLLIPLLHAMDEMKSITTGDDVRRAKRDRAERGEWTGSTPALGYKVQTTIIGGRTQRILVIDPELGWLVIRMYESYDRGISPDRLSFQLNEEGIRTQREKLWSRAAIMVILKNEVYKGTLVYGRKSNSSKHGVIRVENACDTIITEELWNRVQTKMAKRAPHKERETARNHLLTGLLRCGKCGGRMNARAKRSRTGYYTCENRRLPAPYKCDAKGIPMEQAERRIIEDISSVILRPEHMDELINILESEAEEAKRHQEENLEGIRQELERNSKQKSNLLKLVRENDDLDTSVIADELVELQKLQDALLEAKIDEEVRVNKRTQITDGRDQIKAFVEKLREGLNTDDPIQRREVLTTVCDRITGEKEKGLTVHYKIPTPPENFASMGRARQVSLNGDFPGFDNPAWAELRRKLRLKRRPSLPMSTASRAGATGDSPAYSSSGLK